MGNTRYTYNVNSFSYYQSLCYNGFNIFDYIDESVKLGCTKLEPWYGHFTELNDFYESFKLCDKEVSYLSKVLQYAQSKGITFNLLTVDGDTYVYAPKETVRRTNINNAKKWIDIAHLLQARGVRFDASLPEETIEFTSEVQHIVCSGYRELIDYGKEKNVDIFIENHFGITSNPDNLLKILNALPDLKYLFDSWNWNHKKVAEAWLKCIKYADEVHIKTFFISERGEDILVNIPSLLNLLEERDFKGSLTIETMPLNLECERKLIADTLSLIKNVKENET